MITLGPLPERPTHVGPDDDAGIEIPEGTRACQSDADCADDIECTVDTCLPAKYCSNELDNSVCSDGLICNGVESCDPQRGCIVAPPPSCDDQDVCTIDRCDEETKECAHDPRDFDRDGEVDFHCGDGTDCDDFDPLRGMNARELCGDAIDNDCDDIVDEAGCGPVPHDACDDALDVSAGGVFEVSVVGAQNDYVVSCNSESTTRDVVFAFHTDAAHDVKLVASGLKPEGDEDVTNLSLRTRCTDNASELQCAHGFPGDLRVRSLPAGDYEVVVSTTYAANVVVLDVVFDPPTDPPANSSCENAINVGTGGHYSGSFVDVADATKTSCGDEGQPDLFYKISLTEISDVEISVIGNEAGALTVALRRGACAPDAVEERCERAPQVLSRHHELPPGDYMLVLEGPLAREIGFELDVAVLPPTPPPAADSCSSAQPAMIGGTQRIPFSGLQNDVASSCQSIGPDAVMTFTLDMPQDVQIDLDTDNSVGSLSVQATCGDVMTERVCRSATSLHVKLYDVPVGQYYVIVDSAMASGVNLTIDTSPATQTAPAVGNDTCYSALEIPITGGTFKGDTRTLMQDYSVQGCAGGTLSKDAAFKLVLPSTKVVSASVDALFDSALALYGAPIGDAMLCAPESVRYCLDGDDVGLVNREDTLEAGTYYFVVDGYGNTSQGEYLFKVETRDPP